MYRPSLIIQRVALTAALPLVVGVAGLHLGCAKPQTMVSASGVPASEGTVKATVGDNGNTKVSIRVKHLAPPSKIASDAVVYVVWLQPRNAAKQNIGALVLNDNLEGSLDTMTPHNRFMITVTPEPGGKVAEPTHEPVFTADVEHPG